MAGLVKAKGDARRARSDWMKVEQERGISVASSVMTFEYKDAVFNLLDTPGHEDFSEDTYRVLTAVDSAIMVIDAAKGIEARTRKLFEICRLRSIPIITFINKLDREGRSVLELLDLIEHDLQLHVSPLTIPVGQGRAFLGCYDRRDDTLILMDKTEDKSKIQQNIQKFSGADDPKLGDIIPSDLLIQLQQDLEMVALYPAFDRDAYLSGDLTPVFFGSALNNFGVKELLDGVLNLAPAPRSVKTLERIVEPTEKKVVAFVFKIQANMDPKHHDRIAFARICSGDFKKGMKLLHTRLKKQLTLHNPLMFLAQDRESALDAFPGDIIGIQNHGNLSIGDTLTEGENLHVIGIPSFAPDYLKKIRAQDPMKAKHLSSALFQIAEEGGASVFKPAFGTEFIIGAVGPLQFEVMADRLRTEFNVPAIIEDTTLYTARWVFGDKKDLELLVEQNKISIAYDHTESPVFLARNAWHLQKAQEDFPKLKFADVKNG